MGNQVRSDWLPLIGVTYDPKDGLVEIALEGLDHMIRGPREIYVEEEYCWRHLNRASAGLLRPRPQQPHRLTAAPPSTGGSFKHPLQRAPHVPHPPSAETFHTVMSYQSRPISVDTQA